MDLSFLDLLISPEEKTALTFNSSKSRLESKSGKYQYEVKENIPIFLTPKAYKKTLASSFHQQYQTDFSYLDHYQKDAIYFDYFEDIADGPTFHENRRLHETIIAQIPNSISTILDIGSGNAWLGEYYCPLGVQVFSLDPAIQNAIKGHQKVRHKNHIAVVGDVYALPFKEQSFDCVIAAEVIEHVPNPTLFIEKLISVTKKGGTIIITTPYKEVIPKYLCVHCNHPTPRNAHLHSFDEHKLSAMLPMDKIKKDEYGYFFKQSSR